MPEQHPLAVTTAAEPARLAFGPFVLDRSEHTLARDGMEVALPERSLRLLETLIRSAGRTVSKDRLVEEVWQGGAVSDTSLTEAVCRLRRALGDAAREPRYVRTVHGRGYRFIAAVHEPGPPRGVAGRGRPRWLATAASLALATIAWSGLALLDGERAGPEKPPRFRLAEVAMNGGQLSRYDLPALPLNDLSVQQDGSRVAFSVGDGDESDVWVLEPGGAELRRVTTGGHFSDPVWTPDGRQLALAHSRDDDYDLVLKEVDHERPARVLLEAPLDQFPDSWSRDGRSLVYSERHPETGFDLWLLSRGDDDSWTPSPLVRTPAQEAFGALAPDGRYLAYTALTGRAPEVFVVDLEGDGAPRRVSQKGGAYPFWSVSGDRLHYVRGDEIRTVAADRLDAPGVLAAATSTTVAGLYLADLASPPGRVVVALTE